VSNRGAKEATEPTFGTLGPSDEETTIEMALPASAPVQESAPAVEEGMLLDAYWASFGNAETRAAMRHPEVRDGLLEVVIGPDDRVEVGNTEEYPWRCIASLLVTAADGSNWIGTAWLVSPRLMLTAGHCVYMHDRGGWVRQIEVIPGRRGSARPFGSCSVTDFRSVRGWTQNRDRDFDYAAILLPESCRLGDQLGWLGFEVRDDDELDNLTINISGYPGDKPAGTQWFHSNVVTGLDERVITYEIDTAGGQSGAPVWVLKPGVGRFGVGIHTNGSLAGNSATRISSGVFNNIVTWREAVP
jgi:V8-like Glu-specific endopeptidase